MFLLEKAQRREQHSRLSLLVGHGKGQRYERAGLHEKGNGDTGMMSFGDILAKLEQVDSLMYSVEGAMIAAAPEDGGAEVAVKLEVE